MRTLTRAALLGATALALAGLAAAPAAANEATAEPTTEVACGNPLVLLSPGAHVESGHCSAVSVLEQELEAAGSGNLLLLSTLLNND
ncbi:hypothetical protein [Nocardiopsis tropica]|uniref:Secreted protein n=1 Tax=Nocardiopsis tropica TaxID=109330 RepID=A0ABU7KMI6_9ACTN|nr:hypothetical protein [Nocardiopsis umidischolae]MEE2050494.1 hypothetical protein [Nocardiopsis umidischolae]